MSRIRSRGTGPERRFQLANPSAVPHPDWLPLHPDFLLDGRVVYVDSGFWHLDGVRADKFGRMPEFWQRKLIRNYCRDLEREDLYGDLAVIVPEEALSP